MKLEYYYLFGLDIPLKRHSLGVIRQPKLIDFIDKDVDVDAFYLPFLINDYIIGQSGDKDSLIKLKEHLGSLSFLMMNCYQTKRMDILDALKKSVGMLYDCEVELGDKLNLIVNDVVIDNSNFDILCEIVLEMFKVDKSKMKFEKDKEDELDPITARFEELRRKHKEKVGDKNKPLSTIDVVNIVLHSNECGLDYKKVFNMTYYQIKNTFETLGLKELSDTMLQYKLSQKFDFKDEVKSWHSKKIVKSSSIKLDV